MLDDMVWYLWFALAAFICCIVAFLGRFIHLLRLGAPKDLSKPSGKVSDGVCYSCTTAMLPQNKESAYLHLPTYTAGIFFHIGNFLALATSIWLFIAFILKVWPSDDVNDIVKFVHISISIIFVVSSICGISILSKRIIKKELREISSFDDYFSNIICTLMQIFTVIFLFVPSFAPFYFLMVSLVYLWMPVGKIRHLLFFFMARYHLGFFYGRRGVWPPAKID